MRAITAIFLFSTLAVVGLALGTPARAQDPAPEACSITKFGTPQVENACKRGGRKAAKDLMKEAVKRSKAGGGEGLKCNDCHSELKNFALKPGALDKLKPLL